MNDELEWIRYFKTRIPRRLQGRLGIGDDAEMLTAPRARHWVFSSDAIVEGVDFVSGLAKPENVGRKALAVNLSDMAAMGARPYAFTIAVGLPRRMSSRWVKRFYDGLIGLADTSNVLFAGGDLSRSREFFASVAIWGVARYGKPIARKGAKPGDLVVVTGRLGGSILGHHCTFVPRVKEAEFLSRFFRPTAMIDISDGFAQDLGHILESSRVGASIDLDHIPVSPAAYQLARSHGKKALIRALSDGEDFELLFTLTPRKWTGLQRRWKENFPKTALCTVGTIVRSKRNEIRWYDKGLPLPRFRLVKTGYRHF